MKLISTTLIVVSITLTFMFESRIAQKLVLNSHCPIDMILSITQDPLFKALSFHERQRVLIIILDMFNCHFLTINRKQKRDEVDPYLVNAIQGILNGSDFKTLPPQKKYIYLL